MLLRILVGCAISLGATNIGLSAPQDGTWQCKGDDDSFTIRFEGNSYAVKTPDDKDADKLDVNKQPAGQIAYQRDSLDTSFVFLGGALVSYYDMLGGDSFDEGLSMYDIFGDAYECGRLK